MRTVILGTLTGLLFAVSIFLAGMVYQGMLDEHKVSMALLDSAECRLELLQAEIERRGLK